MARAECAYLRCIICFARYGAVIIVSCTAGVCDFVLQLCAVSTALENIMRNAICATFALSRTGSIVTSIWTVLLPAAVVVRSWVCGAPTNPVKFNPTGVPIGAVFKPDRWSDTSGFYF